MSKAEKEVENLLISLLPTTKFAGLVFSVGGFVRDEVLGLDSKDLDLVVEMDGGAKDLCHFIHSTFPSAVSTPYNLGAAYPIWKISFTGNVSVGERMYLTEGAEVDVADTQSECFPDADTRQRVTVFGSLEDDLRRRDFTVNSLLRDLSTGEIVDQCGGMDDLLVNKTLRTHPAVSPDKTFSDDPLRMVRMVRFCVKYGLQPDAKTMESVMANAARLSIVSSERIRDELIKIMLLGKLAEAVVLFKQTGLLAVFLPEVLAMDGVEQDKIYHSEGCVLTHTMLLVEKAHPTVVAQLSALLHDVGKPATQLFDGNRIKFPRHEVISTEMTEVILNRLKFDYQTIARVKVVITNHLRPHFSKGWTVKAVRSFIRDIGDSMEDVLHNAEIDQLSSFGPDGKCGENLIPALRIRIAETSTGVRKKPLLSGETIMAAFSLPRGPAVGVALRRSQEIEDELAEAGIEVTEAAVLSRLTNERST
jgi:poly(A) polymerase